jgi:hypothetical protein
MAPIMLVVGLQLEFLALICVAPKLLGEKRLRALHSIFGIMLEVGWFFSVLLYAFGAIFIIANGMVLVAKMTDWLPRLAGRIPDTFDWLVLAAGVISGLALMKLSRIYTKAIYPISRKRIEGSPDDFSAQRDFDWLGIFLSVIGTALSLAALLQIFFGW